ncbi:hypothetical protein SARC_09741 [Sphaeroforma arctica JP610]|uniref:Rho-GAP domain-containing protein n=1 Tax=Sphaeroforma arctica JP610 TaxID=667725 RepID=A0A0L0FM07_9EUKA|nr:hypothetical protein SARC_09741 [Sphaeroforma arctica JP610]KNC77812.1 hypothetical protein SARC_09741 [Sphaeroforma arctica JP610]|eukprot:XP_014151714.1 hypothetical protein SARC_09741 [Sphaeroforma arctica JP610]
MIRELAQTVTRLPAANYHTLKAIVMHLGNVMARADVNKMTSHNLAIVFGPTLIRPAKETPLEAIENITPSTSIMEKMILHREHIFGSESMAESSARGET